jgi:hypothetical protein
LTFTNSKISYSIYRGVTAEEMQKAPFNEMFVEMVHEVHQLELHQSTFIARQKDAKTILCLGSRTPAGYRLILASGAQEKGN